MKQAQAKVREFHETFDLVTSDTPGNLTDEVMHRRFKLIVEELSEYVEAVMNRDIIGVADALGDLIYVVLGSAVEHGIEIEPVFDEIHRSNMTKKGGHKNEFGKWVKPPGWQPPDIATVLAEQQRGVENYEQEQLG